MSFRNWWQQKSRPAKSVTALTTLLILQMGLCFASPSEPAWFDRLFNLHQTPDQLRLGLVMVEAYLCAGTFIVLLVALLVWGTSSFGSADLRTTLIERDANDTDGKNHHGSGDSR